MRLEGCLSIIKGNYDMEYSLYLAKKIGIHAGGGTEKRFMAIRCELLFL